MKYKTNIIIGEDEFKCEFDYHKREKQTHWHPGCDAWIELISIIGLDIDSLTPQEIEAIEQKALEEYEVDYE